MSARRSVKRVCETCQVKKSELDFPTTRAKTCTECLRKAEIDEKIAIEQGRATPEEVFTAPLPVEIDPTNPTVQELAARTLARRRLLPFIKRFRPNYLAGWVHEDICRRLERFMNEVEAKKEPRLLLCVPVRHGKSEIGSRHFAPWILGHHPDWEIIAASGAQSLATSFSRYIRDLMRSDVYRALFPETALDPTSQSVENWNTTGGGGYLAAGVGTMITGRGASVLILDDVVKDAEAADSQVIRDNTWEWYLSTALSRLAPGGGVVVIMCMTGDTPVMMADGTQRRLDSLKKSDLIATYANGILAATRIKGIRSNGLDSVLKMRMRSGKIVRANQRHPFLTVLPNGRLAWVRLKNLTSASKIVIVKDSGVNGEALPVLPRGAKSLPCVADYANATIEKHTGRRDIALLHTTTSRGEALVSSTDTALQQKNMTVFMRLRTGVVRFVENTLKRVVRRVIGRKNSLSTTATPPEKYEGFSATDATLPSELLPMSHWHWPLLGISDFTLDEVVSIEPDGVEEVFDVQVEHTENFIANGLVSHNTHWNEDDLAGRLMMMNEMDDGGDKFEVVRYPAINDQGDEYILADDSITQFPPGSTIPIGARLTREMNTALHPARYTLEALLRRKATYAALGQQRWWAALYQQAPAIDDGVFFRKEMFKFYTHEPHLLERAVYQAWDFAITEDQQSDYTVCVTGIQDVDNNLFVADITRFKSSDSFVIADAIIDTWVKHGSCALIGFEDGQIWKTLKAVFLRRCEERRVYPPHELLVPLTDKAARAQPLRGLMQGGKVWFKEKAAWWEEARKEMTQFLSGGKHDDIVDALAWMARLSLTHRVTPRKKEKTLRSWKDKLKAFGAGIDGSHMSA